MFGRLRFLRLKTAEHALRDGQLDEAHRLASAADLAGHSRAVELLKELTARLIERAESHASEDRFVEALADLQKAETGGIMAERIAELRRNIEAVSAATERAAHQQGVRLAAARARLEAGSVAAGRRLLDDAPLQDQEVRRLKEEADRRATEAATQFQRAGKMIDQKHLAAAVACFRRARTLHADSPIVAGLEGRLCKAVVDNTVTALRDGHLSRAEETLSCLADVGRHDPARREAEDMVHAARAARGAFRSGNYETTIQELIRLDRLLPKSVWIKKTLQDLRGASDVLASLRAGPLGPPSGHQQVGTGPGTASRRAGKARGSLAVSPPGIETRSLTAYAVGEGHGAPALPERLLLLIEGGGSYLLLRGDRATIGRAVASKPPDIPIYSDLAEHHAELGRIDQDYFLIASREVTVGGKPTRHHLLRDGDRVVLGRKAKFTFRLPSRKSASAIIDLSDSSKLPHDVRRVVLFADHAVVGSGRNVHIGCPTCTRELVLLVREGRLWIRPASRPGESAPPAELVELGQSMEIEGMGFVVKTWEPQATTGRKKRV